MCPLNYCSRLVDGPTRNGSHPIASAKSNVLILLETVHGNLFSLSLECLEDK